MLRGILGPMEKHHKVRISDAAIVAAVNLSHRYIPARQLPDKAVSLLDTACGARRHQPERDAGDDRGHARGDCRAREGEGGAGQRQRPRRAASRSGSPRSTPKSPRSRKSWPASRRDWASEQKLVDEIRSSATFLAPTEAEGRQAAGRVRPRSRDAAGATDKDDARKQLREKFEALEGIDPEKRMIYAHVDEQAVASVVSDWTGIPVGRMVKDEIENVLRLPEILNRRVVGQSHGLAMIAKRIETNRAKLDNPNKPIGVFMLCGPSGVGKTETALALAEALYGGEQNMITINMSEFQEAHTVSSLKGRAARLCRLWRGRPPHRGGPAQALQRDPA